GGRGRGGVASPGGGRGRGRGGGSGSGTLAMGPPYVPGGTTAATVGARKKSSGRAKGKGGAGHRTGAAVPVGAAAAGERKRKRTGGLVTITEINEDELMAVANQNWAPGSKAAAKGSFKPKLVSTIYRKELRSCMPTPGARAGPESSSRLQLLEFSAFLENYLWPNFDADKSSTEHLMSTILLINSKFHEGVSVWESLGISEGRLGNLPVTADASSSNPSAAAAQGAAADGGDAAGTAASSAVAEPTEGSSK
ncbi:unnamed protein product, partial [Ectocarpus sp. 13 AM-2016]